MMLLSSLLKPASDGVCEEIRVYIRGSIESFISTPLMFCLHTYHVKWIK